MMKLRWAPTSPYVRKVVVAARETGLDERIELVPTNVWSPDTDAPSVNPLGKVPTLVLEDGLALFDSPVICEYLDGLHDGPKLFPPDGPARWRALRQHALGDGITEAAVLTVLEGRRPEAQRLAPWLARQKGVVGRALDTLEAEADALAGQPTIGHIGVGAALGYVEFRMPDLGWREGRPALAAWYEEFSARPSMQATVPREWDA